MKPEKMKSLCEAKLRYSFPKNVKFHFCSVFWAIFWFIALNYFLYLLYCNSKEKDHIRRKLNSEKKNIYMWNQYCYFDLPKIRVGWTLTTKNWVTFALCMYHRNYIFCRTNKIKFFTLIFYIKTTSGIWCSSVVLSTLWSQTRFLQTALSRLTILNIQLSVTTWYILLNHYNKHSYASYWSPVLQSIRLSENI